jgi:hypothetical protein
MRLIAPAKSPATESCTIRGRCYSAGSGIVLETTSSRTSESSIRFTASSESPPCVAHS